MRVVIERLKSVGLTIRSRWWVLPVGILLVPAIWAADRAYFWVAWNWWDVPFQAACRDYEDLYDGDIDDYHFIEGELSQEFWGEMRFLLQATYPRLRHSWQEDGVLIVPRGLLLPVQDAFWSRTGQEPEELSHWIARLAAGHIYGRRVEEGVDMAPYARYIEKEVHYWRNFDGPSPDVCGMMEKLVLKGGELSRPGRAGKPARLTPESVPSSRRDWRWRHIRAAVRS